MGKIFRILTYIIVSAFLLNCTTNTKIIKTKAVSNNINSFEEISIKNNINNEQPALIIKATLSEEASIYLIGKPDKFHNGKQAHIFQLNIDGQAVVWEVKGQSAIAINYTLEKRISIKAGKHTIFFALPDDDYYIEFPLAITDIKTNSLEFKPVYRHSRLHTTTHKKRISYYEVYYNGKRMDLDYPRVSH